MKRSGMFRERNERPSTAGEAEERSGYMELYAVARRVYLAFLSSRISRFKSVLTNFEAS